MKSLTKKQTNFIIALMKCDTITEAYKQAGISQASAYKYLKDPMVKQAISDLRTETMRVITNKLMAGGTLAVDTLTDVMHDENASSGSRVNASRAMLEYLTKHYNFNELKERLEQMEGGRFDDDF